ncbi:DNA helicase B isoform X3 [Corvus cornix cornix]|uniref:DNA helicase B isoform X3 n=1 Tax=Corvus cornix cornix TaxID=932674 RepID=UPI00194DB5E5|nr:DNA helicase B isoform X3 [Corvus cornix cornix]
MAVSGGQRGPRLDLWGHLRPLRQEAAGDEEESDEDFEEEPLLAEDALLEAAGRELSAALPPRRAVIIQECGTKKEYEVVGRFPLVDPWWKVNVKAKKMGSKYFVQGYPSYFLQTDVEENNRQVFSLFLKECNVPESWKEKFFAWLPMESVLSFRNLEEKLKQFQVSQLQPRRIQRDTKDYDIFYYVSKSFAGKAVLGALAFPRILEFLPILLPRHFCCVLDKMCWQRKADMDGEEVADEMVTKLDEILKDEPWKLGFSRQMEIEVEAASKDFEEDLDASEEWNTFDHHWESENMYAKKFLNVLFTAPTGRATSLLREKTQLPAYTLHQIIYSFKSWRRTEQAQPWKFSAVTVLIVDEGSLVSVHILSLVLKLLCEHAQLAKLIILGDTRQLPSIDPGNMLADIFEGLKSRGFSVELRTNHRAESQLIVDNASRISHRQLPEFDEVLKVSAWNEEITMPSPEKKFIFIALAAGGNCDNLQTAIKILLKKGPGLEDAKQSQFIAFRRQDCDLINELCCQHYSNHLTRDHKNRLLFQVGDKIACTRNVYLKDLLAACGVGEGPNGHECRSGGTTPTAEADEEGKRLCNGDIFFITGDEEIDKEHFLTISSMYGSTFTVNYKALRKLCHIKHAWARTIHTFQGSEERTVVYVVGNAGWQHWQHVYTAVTRGRCRVYIVAEELHLRRAIKRKNVPRKTRLQRFLREAIAETNNCPKQISSPLMKCWQSQELETESVSVTQGAPDPPELQSELMTQEGSSVLSKEQTGSLLQSPCKRQIPAPQDVTKIPPTTVAESPLGSSRLKNLTLGQPIPKKLFKS